VHPRYDIHNDALNRTRELTRFAATVPDLNRQAFVCCTKASSVYRRSEQYARCADGGAHNGGSAGRRQQARGATCVLTTARRRAPGRAPRQFAAAAGSSQALRVERQVRARRSAGTIARAKCPWWRERRQFDVAGRRRRQRAGRAMSSPAMRRTITNVRRKVDGSTAIGEANAQASRSGNVKRRAGSTSLRRQRTVMRAGYAENAQRHGRMFEGMFVCGAPRRMGAAVVRKNASPQPSPFSVIAPPATRAAFAAVPRPRPQRPPPRIHHETVHHKHHQHQSAMMSGTALNEKTIAPVKRRTKEKLPRLRRRRSQRR